MLQHRALAQTVPVTDDSSQNCPEWCEEDRFQHFTWVQKCWNLKCLGCEDWKTNCPAVWKEGRPTNLCAGWCGGHLAQDPIKRDEMMCQWVNCQSCPEMVEKCSCPAWCKEDRLQGFDWAQKCWTLKCSGCEDWQTNCPAIWKEGRPTNLCASWCKTWLKTVKPNPEKRELMMCRWVECQSCDEFVEECTRAVP